MIDCLSLRHLCVSGVIWYICRSLFRVMLVLNCMPMLTSGLSMGVFASCYMCFCCRLGRCRGCEQKNGRTALHLASINGKSDIVAALLAAGANINAVAVSVYVVFSV